MTHKLIKGLILSAFLNTGCIVIHEELPVAGVQPVYPMPKGKMFAAVGYAGPVIEKFQVSTDVDSLHPTLQWKPYAGPHEENQEVTREVSIENVSYELRIWQEEPFLWNKPAYHKTGIVETRHTLEQALNPSAEYFWSLRAWFDLNGQRRVTDWSLSFLWKHKYTTWKEKRDSGQIDPENYMRFETPWWE